MLVSSRYRRMAATFVLSFFTVYGTVLQTSGLASPALEAWFKSIGLLIWPLGAACALVVVAVVELAIYPIWDRLFNVASLRRQVRQLRRELENTTTQLADISSKFADAEHRVRENTARIQALECRPVLLVSHEELVAEMTRIAQEAKEFLYITGSRTSIPSYIAAIETRVAEVPDLIHFRVLIGYPWRENFKTHLKQLRQLRPIDDRAHGKPSCFLGIYLPYAPPASKRSPVTKPAGSKHREPEFYLSVNEKEALLIVPSLNAPGAFDSCLLVRDPPQVKAWKQYVEWLAVQSEELAVLEAIDKLPLIDRLP